MDGRYVTLDAGAPLHLPQVRHPLLVMENLRAAERLPKKRDIPGAVPVEPVDLILRPDDRILIISGGNAGGKTVALKTLGLVALMTSAGLPCPVGPGAAMPVWRDIHAFIGDEQSLDDHVSTFTGQIRHLAAIWEGLDQGALVLLDEFGAGTDPSQGAALAQAVLDGLLEKDVYAVAATHFPALKTFALTRAKVRAASVLFDPASKKPLYRLAYDQVGASQALDVAREHGLPDAVLRRAEHYLLMDGADSGLLMDRLNALAREREDEVARLREEQAQARDARRQARERLDRELARLDEEVRKNSQELMSAWKNGKTAAKRALKEMAGLRAEIRKPEERETPAPLRAGVGDVVRHRPWDRRAVVMEMDEKEGRAKIDMNGVALWTSLSDLETAGPSAPDSGNGAITARVSPPLSLLRLDLRGKRADLDLMELEHFLDRALLAGPDGVEILHGRGTGALRKAVHQFLRNYPGMASYATAPDEQGGDGVTLVSFR